MASSAIGDIDGPKGLALGRHDLDIFCEGFEPLSVRLDDGNGYMTGLSGLNISYDTRFARMDTADDFAFGAVF